MKNIKNNIVSGVIGLGMLFSIGCSPKYQIKNAILKGNEQFGCWYDKKDSTSKYLLPADTTFDLKYDCDLAFYPDKKVRKKLYKYFRNDQTGKKGNDPENLIIKYLHFGKDQNKLRCIKRVNSKKLKNIRKN